MLAESPRVFDDPARLGRVRIASRLLVLATFGLPLLGAAYLLGRRVAGVRTGVALALMLGLVLAAKFSGVLAAPPAALALVIMLGRPATRRLADGGSASRTDPATT